MKSELEQLSETYAYAKERRLAVEDEIKALEKRTQDLYVQLQGLNDVEGVARNAFLKAAKPPPTVELVNRRTDWGGLSWKEVAKPFEGSKRLLAFPMTRGEYNQYRGWKVPLDENPADPGYMVEYEDGGASNHPNHKGYISWSPKDVFERSYHQIK